MGMDGLYYLGQKKSQYHVNKYTNMSFSIRIMSLTNTNLYKFTIVKNIITFFVTNMRTLPADRNSTKFLSNHDHLSSGLLNIL